MSTPNAERLLNSAQTLLALSSAYAAAKARIDYLETLGERGGRLRELREATEAYEELVADWLGRLDTARRVYEGSALLASWRDRVEPLLSLLPASSPRNNPRSPRRRARSPR